MTLNSRKARNRVVAYMNRHVDALPFQAISRACHLTTYLQAAVAYADLKQAVRRFRPGQNVETAVVVHLYYADRWPALKESLSTLKMWVPFDLFVTVPRQASDEMVRSDFPAALVGRVPNLGRDVVPFMQIAPLLPNLGYRYVLKLHSKKSLHHRDLDGWFHDILSALIPTGASVADHLRQVLDDAKTGVIGPAGQYLSVSSYLEDNRRHMRKELSRLAASKEVTAVLEGCSFGFFAGTMFWARLDSLQRIFECQHPLLAYEPEQGRVNGTLVHTLERLFSIVPALERRNLYEIGRSGLAPVDPGPGVAPWWLTGVAEPNKP